MPPAEAAFHPDDGPANGNTRHELYSLCDDLKAEMAALEKKGVHFSGLQEARWGSIAKLRLPGGGDVGLYQPKHKRLYTSIRINRANPLGQRST
jgi:hypothetical protein